MVKLPDIGDEFAGYRIEAMLGKGGMGVVYRARHLGLDRAVALKLLPEGLTEDSSFRARFERESRLAAAMEHPNIVPIYEAGEHDQLLYIVMRYVPGSDLKQIIERERRLPVDRALALMAQAASALDAAHSKDLVHRDVKPHNMLVAPETGWSQEHLYLTDFGLAKKTSSSAAITATGSFMGTVFYVAPEQIEGTRHVGPQVDVYSLGCVFYECLTGAVPFDGDSDMAIVGAHLNRPPPKVSENAGLPPAIDEVIATAMAKDPAERYPLCTTMVADARAALADAGWEVDTLNGIKDSSPGSSRGDTLTAPAPVAGPENGSLGTVPTPKFRFGRTPTPSRTSQAVAAAGPAPRKRRRWLLPVLTILAAAVAAATSYLLLFSSDGDQEERDITFPARASSDMPEALPRRVDKFILKADKSELVDALEPFEEKLGGAYQLKTSQTFVNHYIVLYGTETAASQDYNDQLDFLTSNGFQIVEEEPLKNASGGNVGDVALLRRSEPRAEEAIAWTNGRLSVGARGVPGQALDFFSASSN
jgi:serine/threonine protein kinase